MSVRPGDQAPFLVPHGNSVRLGRSAVPSDSLSSTIRLKLMTLWSLFERGGRIVRGVLNHVFLSAEAQV